MDAAVIKELRLVGLGDEILPSYMGMTIHRYKDPH